MKLRVRHTKLGKVRFTSHRDTARHWERAVRKSGIAVAYSAGFTPRPRMSFGLALPTGAESLAEYLDIDLVDDVTLADLSLDDLCVRFAAALPVGYEVTHIVSRESGATSLQEDVVACTWRITLDGVQPDQLVEAVTHTMSSSSVLVERERKGQRSTDDIRPAMLDLSVAPTIDDDHRPHLCAMVATNGRGLRPTELVASMFPTLDPVDTAARVLRTQQWIEREGELREVIPAHPLAARAPAECA
ncbi:MAG: TIGR03936 family radical SAM-associated protein [Actinomycetota bacterium]